MNECRTASTAICSMSQTVAYSLHPRNHQNALWVVLKVGPVKDLNDFNAKRYTVENG